MVTEYVTRLFCLRVLLPVILTFGTVGNILCIITLLHKKIRKSSTGFILIQMALLDIGQMITSMINIWDLFISELYYIGYHPVLEFLRPLLRQVSALTLCMLTVERVLYQCIVQSITGASVVCVEWRSSTSLLQQFSRCATHTSSDSILLVALKVSK